MPRNRILTPLPTQASIEPSHLFNEADELKLVVGHEEVGFATENRLDGVIEDREDEFTRQIEDFYRISEEADDEMANFPPVVILEHVIAPGIRYDQLMYERSAPNGDFQRGRALYFYDRPAQPYTPSWSIVQAREFLERGGSRIQTLTPTLYSTTLLQNIHSRLVAAQYALYDQYAAEVWPAVAKAAADTDCTILQLRPSGPDA